MILAIDIGNTNIVVGCIDKEKIYFIERLSTVRTKTELEYAIDLKTVLDIYHIKRTDIEGCIISSVVPQITNVAKLAAEKILKKEVLVLGPGVKTGLNIMLDNLERWGHRVADAVAALTYYPVPLVIVDMGTATTVSVVDEKKRYLGGMILPGVRVSLDALISRASQLSGISIEEPKKLIGKNTVDCMKSGILYGNAAAVDGIIDRIEEELGKKVTAIATGGMSGKIIPHCKRKIIQDEDLLLKGLLVIYEKINKNRKQPFSSISGLPPDCGGAAVLESFPNVGRNRGRNAERRACYGTGERKLEGVQRLTAEPGIIRTVEIIRRKRIAQISHMYPDLMSAPCFQMNFQKRMFMADRKPFKMRNSRIAFRKIHLTLDHRSGYAAYGSGYSSFFRSYPFTTAR